MRIPCPFCGPRDSSEFSYLGDATVERPTLDASDVAVHDYVYLRTNPAGAHRELWYHLSGCHGWIVVARDTLTHAIAKAHFAKDANS
jgi:heterotetrameric sarcosine oxidase delta subunit